MLKYIEKLIEEGANLNEKDEQGKTLLMIATEQGNFSAVIKLLENGANPFLIDHKGQTALMKAVLFGQEKICLFLLGAMQGYSQQRDKMCERALDMARRLNLKNMCDILSSYEPDKEAEELLLNEVKKEFETGNHFNGEDEEGRSFLMHMVCAKNNKICKFLIDKNVDINHQCKEGMNALMQAVLVENEEMVNVLLEQGAFLSLRNSAGQTALDMAKDLKVKESIIQKLEEAVTKAKEKEKERLMRMGKKEETLQKLKNEVNMNAPLSPFHQEFADLINQEGALENGFNIKNNRGITPLMFAALTGEHQIAKWLIELGADVNIKGVMGETVLMTALREMDVEMVKLLIRNGADVEVQNFEGETPLLLATKSFNTSLIRLLVQEGADINKKTKEGVSALDIVIKNEDYEIAAFMKSIQEERNKKNSLEEIKKSLEQDKRLYKAIQIGNKRGILRLLEKGADIKMIDDDGEGVLFMCLRHNKISAFKTFVEQGAFLMHRNKKNQTILDILPQVNLPKHALKSVLTVLTENDFDFSSSRAETKKWLADQLKPVVLKRRNALLSKVKQENQHNHS